MKGLRQMSLEEKLLNEFKSLPDDKKVEVLDFVEFLKAKSRKLESMMDAVIDDNLDALNELAK
jgi:hypothetical protein